MERLRLLVEGVNNKIRVLQRRAYGYRDEEYLKLKIVAAFLPPLPRNAVFNCIVFAQRPGDTGEHGSGTHLTLGIGTAGGRSGTESSAEPNKCQCVSTTKCFEEGACRSFSDSTWTA